MAGNTVTVGVGARDGVAVGATGKVFKRQSVGDQIRDLPIATFRVTRVGERESTALLTEVGQGFAVDAGMRVAFDEPLVRPTPPEPPVAPATAPPRPPADPVELLRQGNAAWAREDWPAAASAYERLLAAVPGHPIAQERRPLAQAKIEEAQRAVVAAREAEAERRRRAEAEAQAERARQTRLAQERRNLPLYRETAKTYLDGGQWEKAAEWLGKIAAADPRDAYLGSVLAARRDQAQSALTAGRLDEATAECDAVLGVVPDDPGTLDLKRQIGERQAQARAAQIAAWVQEGDAALARGDRATARASWRKAGGVDPAAVRERLGQLEWVRIAAGSFWMGCVPGDGQCDGDEKPRHRVTLSRPYWIMTTEVTVGQYLQYASATGRAMPRAPGFSQTDEHPVVNVSWDEAVAYCRWAGGRLPTEAEWEYAARGGKEGQIYPWGNEYRNGAANCDESQKGGTDRRATTPVGSFVANGFGLFDTAGNVWEWCADWYGSYSSGAVSDPSGPTSGSGRVLRGGSWNYNPRRLRSSYRNWYVPSLRFGYVGFRCVRDASL